jgi:hypothetical protein
VRRGMRIWVWEYPAWDAERQLGEMQVRGRVPGGATRSGAFRASGERIYNRDVRTANFAVGSRL